jgi:hypothetical protein
VWQNNRPGLVDASGRSQLLDVNGEHDPPVGGAGQRQPGEGHPQLGDIDSAGAQGVIQGAMTTAVLDGQRQVDQASHRPTRAQQRVGELKQRVRPT